MSEVPEEVDGRLVRPSVRRLAEGCVRERAPFVSPKAEPCARGCTYDARTRQCSACGWLRPLGPDDPFREIPLGTSAVCRLGLTDDEVAYLNALGV